MCRNSQGFCCNCDLGLTLSGTFEGGSSQLQRGNPNCNFLSNGLFLGGVPGSAHCLRLDDSWWFLVSSWDDWLVISGVAICISSSSTLKY